MGLAKILLFAALTGFSIIFTYKITGGMIQAGLGFVILDELSQNLDSSSRYLIIIVSLILTIVFIYGLASFFRQVYEERLFGIITAFLGFLGSVLVLSNTSDHSYFLYTGITSWFTGIALIFLKKNKKF